MVRASSHKTIFDNRYMPNWSREHIKINKAISPWKGTRRRKYKFVDYNDENVKVNWYLEKLQKIFTN